jgi:hypothetical protein
MSTIKPKQGKWFIERIEGITQINNRECPACSKKLRHATIVIRAENEGGIDPDKLVDIGLNRSEPLMIDDAETVFEKVTGTVSPTEIISGDDNKTRIVGFWCTYCKTLYFWE